MTSTPRSLPVEDDLAAAPAPRRVGARRALPNGRAVVGAFLVTSAAVGAFLVATPDPPDTRTDYLVLTTDIAAGDPLSGADVAVELLDLGSNVASAAISGSADVSGTVALRDLRAGELLVHDDLLASVEVGARRIGSVHELTIPVPLDRSPATLLAGDRVTVLTTVRVADRLVTEVAAEDVLVLRFDTGTDRIGGATQAVLTLAVDDPDTTVSIAHSAQRGDLTIVRTTRALDDTYPASIGRVADDVGESRP